MDQTEFQSLTSEDVFRKSVTDQFTAMNLRQSQQDVAIVEVKDKVDKNTALTEQIAGDTAAMRAMWNDGVAAKRFFCRLADAYRFLRKEFFVPIGLPLIGLYACAYYVQHHKFPEWVEVIFKLVGL